MIPIYKNVFCKISWKFLNVSENIMIDRMHCVKYRNST